MSSAPANAASTTPALGLGCCPASRRATSTTRRAEPPTNGAASAVASPATRAGTQLARSSSRAADQPNRS